MNQFYLKYRTKAGKASSRVGNYCLLAILFLGLISTACAGVPAAAHPPGLTHRWSFKETSGVTIHDSIGSAHGTITSPNNGVPNASLSGGTLRLSGGGREMSSYAVFPAGLIKGQTDFTVEVWAAPEKGIDNWARVFEFGDGVQPESSFLLSFLLGGDINAQRFEFKPIGTYDSYLSTTLGQRYHYVVTWDSKTERVSWYREGQAIGFISTSGHTLAEIPDDVFWLGRSHYGGDFTASASYNEVRLWNRALSQEEITRHHTDGPQQLLPRQSEIWAHNDTVQVGLGAGALIDVLSNDSPVLDSTTIEIVSGPSNGTAEVLSSGRIRYTHTGSVDGRDQFVYRAKDWSGQFRAQATVEVTLSSGRINASGLNFAADAPIPPYLGVSALPGLTFQEPVAIRSLTLPNKPKQLFVGERGGKIYRIPDIAANPPTKELFFDITQRSGANVAGDGYTECGLMGFALHPQFATNGKFFVFYTPVAPQDNRTNTLSAFSVQKGVNGTFDPATATGAVDGMAKTETVLFSMFDDMANHNGGDIHFGPDGYLYISLGDGGNAGFEAERNAQFIDKELFSGIARIDVDKKQGNSEPNRLSNKGSLNSSIPTDSHGNAYYSVPADNPFLNAQKFNDAPVNPKEVRTEFWAVGLRSPWRMSFDSESGELWVGDVGQDAYEEVDLITKGGNYGWRYREGKHPYAGGEPQSWATSPPIDPIWEYAHHGSNSVIGGVVPHQSEHTPELNGAYIFGDFGYSTGSFWALRRIDGNVTVQRLFNGTPASAFGIDPSNGDILYCHYQSGEIRRLIKTNKLPSNVPAKLSATGIFSDTSKLTPNSGVTPYEVNVPFWSDNAIKQRWVAVADGASSFGFNTNDPWIFPKGTTWIKHFDLAEDRLHPEGARRRIETRVLVKTETEAYGLSYRWNEDQTDADLVPESGVTFSISLKEGGKPITQTYEIPSWADCLTCHNQATGRGLSFNTAQLNRTSDFHGGLNQLDWLKQSGFLNNTPNYWNLAVFPKLYKSTDESASLTARFKSYVAANCAQCHRPDNPMAYADWDARYSTVLDQMRILNVTAKTTSPTIRQLIAPGDPARSVLLEHLKAVRDDKNIFKRMPTIGSYLNDTAAKTLVERWIASLSQNSRWGTWGVLTSSAPFQDDGGVTIHAGKQLDIKAQVNDSSAAIQWFKDNVAIPKATQPTLSIAKTTTRTTGLYTLRITPLSGTPTIIKVPVLIKDPFPLLYGRTGKVSASVLLTPKGVQEQQPGVFIATITKTGTISGELKVNGKSHRYAGAFDSDWSITWKAPIAFQEKDIRLSVDWPDQADTPHLQIAIGGITTALTREFREKFAGAPLYTAGYTALSKQVGYLSISINSSSGSAIVVGALPTGERFSGSGLLMEADPVNTSKAANAVVRLLSQLTITKRLFTEFELGLSQVSGSSRLDRSNPGAGIGATQNWTFNGAAFVLASKRQIFSPSIFSNTFTNRYEILVGNDEIDEIIAGTIRFDGLKMPAIVLMSSAIESKPQINFNPSNGVFTGIVEVKEWDSKKQIDTAVIRKVSGVILGLMGGVGVSEEGVGIRIRHQNAP